MTADLCSLLTHGATAANNNENTKGDPAQRGLAGGSSCDANLGSMRSVADFL